MDFSANPDSRPLPEGWFQHFDASRNLWYYVQTNVMPPKITFTHPAGAIPDSGPLPVLTPKPASGIPSPPYTPVSQDTPRIPPAPVVMPAPRQAQMSAAQLLYASSNRTPAPNQPPASQTVSPTNERASRALPNPPIAVQPQSNDMHTHARSSTLGMPPQSRMMPGSGPHSTGPKKRESIFSQRPGHFDVRSASYPIAPSSFQSNPLSHRTNNAIGGGTSVPHLTTKAQNPTQQTLSPLISAAQVPTPLLFSSAPPAGAGFPNASPALPAGHMTNSPTGNGGNSTQSSSSLTGISNQTPAPFSPPPPPLNVGQNPLPPLPTTQGQANMTGSQFNQLLPGSNGLPPGALPPAKPHFVPSNMSGGSSNFVSPAATGSSTSTSWQLPNSTAPSAVSSNFAGLGTFSQTSLPQGISSSNGIPPITSNQMNGVHSATVSHSTAQMNANATLLLNANLNANIKPPKKDHAAKSQNIKENARQTAEALRQAGRAVGNATKKVAVSTANRFLLGVDFLSALTVALLDPKTGKPIVDPVTLEAIQQGRPDADYSGAINALLLQQQQKPANAAQYQTLIQQIQLMQAQSLVQQQQQPQQSLQPQQTGTGVQVNAQLDFAGLQLNAQYSKPVGHQSVSGNGTQNTAQSFPSQHQAQQQQQILLQQQLAQQQAANQQLIERLQLQQQQYQQLQLQQAQQQQPANQFDLQQLLSQAEATANQQFDAQLQQQMLLMQQQNQSNSQVVYEQNLTISADQQLPSEDLGTVEETANVTGGLSGLFGGYDPSQMLSSLSGGVDLSSLSSGLDLSSLTGGLESSLSEFSLEC